jgi:hypothetical protein
MSNSSFLGRGFARPARVVSFAAALLSAAIAAPAVAALGLGAPRAGSRLGGGSIGLRRTAAGLELTLPPAGEWDRIIVLQK